MGAQLLARERSLRRSLPPQTAPADTNRTLEEIISDGIQQAVINNNGNRAAAARQLGISRTTLWRYLSRQEDEKLGSKEKE